MLFHSRLCRYFTRCINANTNYKDSNVPVFSLYYSYLLLLFVLLLTAASAHDTTNAIFHSFTLFYLRRADAPIMGHLWEMAMCDDIQMG